MSKNQFYTGVFLLILFLAGLFTWRVFYYFQKVSDGTITTADLNFSFEDRLTKSSFSEVVARLPESEVDVDTEDDPSIGSEDAELVIVEFGDFGCPYTREVSYVVRWLAETYKANVRYVYRDFPLDDIHPEARLAAEAGGCAQDQGDAFFWAFHDKLFQNQHNLSEDALVSYAEQVGLDVDEFVECLEDGLFRDEVQEDLEAGQAAGVYGTPTFFFNGQRVEGAIPEDVFEMLIKAYVSNAS